MNEHYIEVTLYDYTEGTQEDMTLAGVRQKLIDIWEDGEEEAGGLTAGDILEADFQTLDNMLGGCGYGIERK